MLGWKVYHCKDSRGSERGWPDLAMAMAGRPLILAELKMPGRQPSPWQTMWLSVLRNIPGLEVHLWRPEHWDEIVSILRIR